MPFDIGTSLQTLDEHSELWVRTSPRPFPAAGGGVAVGVLGGAMKVARPQEHAYACVRLDSFRVAGAR